MKYPTLTDSERAVLDVLAQRGTASLHEILPVLIPEWGLYYAAKALQTLYAMKLIREVDRGVYSLGVHPEGEADRKLPSEA